MPRKRPCPVAGSDDAETEYDEDRGQHPESQRGEMEDGVGAAEVEPHQRVGETDTHEGEEALLDMPRGIGQRIAAVERVATQRTPTGGQ